MKARVLLLAVATAGGLTGPPALCQNVPSGPFTLTFDDLDGNGLGQYFDAYFLDFRGFQVVDHSGSPWGPPHSGSYVLMLDPQSEYRYNNVIKIHGPGSYPAWTAKSVGAYFSTEPGVVVRMSYGGIFVDIGSPKGSWNNQYAEIARPEGDISAISFRWVLGSPPDGLFRFCLDDLTIVPVPEPASLSALALGLVPLGAAAVNRRRTKR